jgi:aerobic-type carbon monoxide dehydrogenase small subunit (CoxS/CutS family)
MTRQYRLIVNGAACDLTAEPCQTLLDALRDRLGLTGTKKGCNEGECASCAVLQERPEPTDEEIKFYLAGNICRCTGYNKITAAVRSAARAMHAAIAPVPARRAS